jgi:hypothetical protein
MGEDMKPCIKQALHCGRACKAIRIRDSAWRFTCAVMLERYTAAASRKGMADEAMAKVIGTKTEHPFANRTCKPQKRKDSSNAEVG